MNILNVINSLVVSLGIPTIVVASIYIGRKLQILSSLEKTVDSIQKGFSSMTSAIVEIQTILKNNFSGINISHTLIEKGASPLQPTEYGASLIEDSGLRKVLDENRDVLCTKIKASLSSQYTEYDVQEKSRELLVSLKNDSMMNPVKEWVYTHPMDIEIILRAGGLWLRDDFLKQPRGINKN